MLRLNRDPNNPILLPSIYNDWEAIGAFNGSVIKHDSSYVMLYRAFSNKVTIQGNRLNLSTIGISQSIDGKSFSETKQFIVPTEKWEIYGCEDPRVTKMDDMYYVFYTALSGFPFNADNIKVAVAVTKDFETIEEKHLVTPFNAKAMALFPEKVNGKYCAILSANTDMPPSKLGIAQFDRIEELWSEDYWQRWYAYLDDHVLSLKRTDDDQVEVGAQPILTDKGWLLVYSHIKDYYSNNKIFGIEAVLLDKNDPRKILARTTEPLLTPEKDYEKYGLIPNIAFPSGAVLEGNELRVYYGGADTNVCLATCKIDELFSSLEQVKQPANSANASALFRFEENPILLPKKEHPWEDKAVFNAAAILEGDSVYLVYRAMGQDDTSVMGLAISKDGWHIDERLEQPIYLPREQFEEKVAPGMGSGCEDPRISKIGDMLYMLYTAYDGKSPPRVALTSLSLDDFLKRNWKWSKPVLISKPDIDDKDAAIFPRQINGKYVYLHRIQPDIWISYQDTIEFQQDTYLDGEILFGPRDGHWDTQKIGICGPPIETEKGWVLLYHGIDVAGNYHVSACLLELENPSKVIRRLDYPLLSPELEFEKEGVVPNVVFPCGAVVKDGQLIVYYGGADTVIGIASMPLTELLTSLEPSPKSSFWQKLRKK